MSLEALFVSSETIKINDSLSDLLLNVKQSNYFSFQEKFSKLNNRTSAIISACLKISMARKFSKISMPKTLKPYFLDIIVDTKA